MREVLVTVASRANYSRLKSVLKAVKAHPHLKLRLVVAASALLDRFGCLDVMEADGFVPDEKIYCVVEGDTPGCMATTTGLFTTQMVNVLQRMRPDVVLVHADRYEVLAAATAAAYMNVPLGHTEGGEVTGTIDERVRHAITKLADVHFPATELSRQRLIGMGEYPDMVFTVGSTALDAIAGIDLDIREDLIARYRGVGPDIDLTKPYLVVVQHPVTTEYGEGEAQVEQTLAAVKKLDIPAVWFWPNVDAGNEHLAGIIRRYRERGQVGQVHFVKNMSPEDFARLLYHSACLVGNTSAGIKEGAFLGVPYACLGSRQVGREHGDNVVFVPHDAQAITEAVIRQVRHGRYPRDYRFGDGKAGVRIADVLATVQFREKKLAL